MTMVLSGFGEPVDITAPPPDPVTDPTDLLGGLGGRGELDKLLEGLG